MGGYRAFIKASFPAIFGQITSTSLKYTGFRYLDSTHLVTGNKFMNGMIAGLCSTIFTHPLDVWKVHAQSGKSILCSGSVSISIFYRGYTKTLSKIAVSSSLFFPLYDYSKQVFSNPILSSGVSAIISTIIIHPLDYLKTRHMLGAKLYQGINPRVYYNGLTLSLMRIVPHFIITMSCIEYLHKTF
jgi:hypothetical protein